MKKRFANATKLISDANLHGTLLATNTFNERERRLDIYGHLVKVTDELGNERGSMERPKEGDFLRVLQGAFAKEQEEIARKSPLVAQGALKYDKVNLVGTTRTAEGKIIEGAPKLVKFRIQNGSLHKVSETELSKAA
ncbi:hypothetical protein HY993_02895 [Candidatus Micrarchaeota archaeon]|nr:hypothetical protein [Candidatus Micrarchaeota archaeon]